MTFTALAVATLWSASFQSSEALDADALRDFPPCELVDGDIPPDAGNLVLDYEVARIACRLPQPAEAIALAGDILAGRHFGFRVEDETLTLVARPNGELNPVVIHGAVSSAPLDPVAGTDDLYLTRLRLTRLDEAMLAFYLVPQLQTLEDGEEAEPIALENWRAPNAPPEPEFDPELLGETHEEELWSEALGETRRLVIYTPPGFDQEGEYAAVFFADGDKVNYYARHIEPMIRAGEIEPLVLVGSASGQSGIVEDRSDIHRDMRNADYTPGYVDGPRFDQHMSFFATELVDFAVDQYAVSPDPSRRAVTGRSSGASFAFMAGYQRPDAFGISMPMSGGWRLEEYQLADENSAIFILAAGLYEPPFLSRARFTALGLAGAGYDVRLTELAAGHTQDIDDHGMLPAIAEYFAAGRD